MNAIERLLRERILVLDGPMGTMIQAHRPGIEGPPDLLNISQPDLIQDIHKQYLDAGADIIETNTFNSNAISMSGRGTAPPVYELNLAAAKIARIAADQAASAALDKPRFVAGAVGPTNRNPSNPVPFEALTAAYYEQTRGLMDGGVDLLMAETVVDTTNAKAALFAFDQYFREAGRRVPVMVSLTITQEGCTLAGETLEAFWKAISGATLLSVGINCGFGARHMKPYIEKVSGIANVYISCHPNAGLPNSSGGYDEKPQQSAAILRDFAAHGWLNIAGGCCGMTPQHIAAIAQSMHGLKPRVPFRNGL
ncbi:MAG TPA: homocysteine S-methyltransferase family protein [Terriglobia bacterium]